MTRYRVYMKDCVCSDWETKDCDDCEGKGHEVINSCADCPLFCEESEECAEFKVDGVCKIPCDTCRGSGDSGVCSNCNDEGVYKHDEFDEAADWFYDNRY